MGRASADVLVAWGCQFSGFLLLAMQVTALICRVQPPMPDRARWQWTCWRRSLAPFP